MPSKTYGSCVQISSKEVFPFRSTIPERKDVLLSMPKVDHLVALGTAWEAFLQSNIEDIVHVVEEQNAGVKILWFNVSWDSAVVQDGGYYVYGFNFQCVARNISGANSAFGIAASFLSADPNWYEVFYSMYLDYDWETYLIEIVGFPYVPVIFGSILVALVAYALLR